MPRAVRFHTSFHADLAARLAWLRANRPPAERARLHDALAAFVRRVGANPAMGRETERRGVRSFRVFPIGGRLPYLVWYHYDVAERDAPVWLAMLLHDAQDRERFDPGRFD